MKWQRKILKQVSYPLLLPISKWYAAKERTAMVDGIALTVQPGVFHPSLFFSTKFLLSWLKQQSLQNLTVLELGAGSGLLAIYAAKQKAVVTASDISTTAYDNIQMNCTKNDVSIQVILSNLFNKISNPCFDIILINPPYYPKNPISENEFAWFCGEDYDYFQALFFQLPNYLKNTSKAIMVLSEDCNIEVIQSLALQNNLSWKLIAQKKFWAEENYLFQITHTSNN